MAPGHNLDVQMSEFQPLPSAKQFIYSFSASVLMTPLLLNVIIKTSKYLEGTLHKSAHLNYSVYREKLIEI